MRSKERFMKILHESIEYENGMESYIQSENNEVGMPFKPAARNCYRSIISILENQPENIESFEKIIDCFYKLKEKEFYDGIVFSFTLRSAEEYISEKYKNIKLRKLFGY